MSLAFYFPHLHTVVGVQIQQYPFQLRYLPEPRLMDFRQPVDGFDPGFHFLELFVVHDVAFIDNDDIRVGDLQVRGRQVGSLMRWFLFDDVLWSGGFVEAEEDVLGVDEGDDAVEID